MDWTRYTLGQRLRLACQLKGWEMQEAADASGVERSTFYNVAADRYTERGPALSNLRLIAAAMGMRLCWLLEGEGEVFRPQTTKTAEAEAPAALPVLPIQPLRQTGPLKTRRPS